jgi:hypothetical protein
MRCQEHSLVLRSPWLSSCLTNEQTVLERDSRMPLQNRVTPFGEIIATPARGLFMGNRGRLHDEHRTLRRQHSSERRWLVCNIQFRERKRTPMSPGQYTELFFLDEATALAAGHRPCAECRNADYRRFKHLWVVANLNTAQEKSVAPAVSAGQIDGQMQAERVNEDGTKQRYRSTCQELPDGVFVTMDEGADAYLLWKNSLYHWTPAGYDHRRPVQKRDIVDVLTPRSIVRTIAAGYLPVVHPTASGGIG